MCTTPLRGVPCQGGAWEAEVMFFLIQPISVPRWPPHLTAHSAGWGSHTPWPPHSAGWGCHTLGPLGLTLLDGGATPPGPSPLILSDGGATPPGPLTAHSAGWGSHTSWPPRAHSAGWGSHTHWPPHRSSACWVYRTPGQIHIFNTANSCHVQQKCTRKPTKTQIPGAILSKSAQN